MQTLAPIPAPEPSPDEAARSKLAADLLLRIRQSRESPLELYRNMFLDEQGNPVVIKGFHEEWTRLILGNRQVMIEASRGLTKTTFLLAAVAWAIGRNQNIRVKWIGETDEHATKRLSVLHEIIDHSPFYKMVFPQVRKEDKNSKRPNNVSMLNVVRELRSPEPTVEAVGVLSAGTGGRSDLIVLDDPVGESNAVLNPSLKPKVLSKIKSDWLGTLVPTGRVWWIFTPWAADDAAAWFKKNAKWAYRRYAHGKPHDMFYSIFPEVWPRERLIERRLWLGEIIYAKSYLCMLLQDGVAPVLPEHLRPITRDNLTQEKLENAIAVVSGDPAAGRTLHKGKADYTGLAVFLVVIYEEGTEPPFEIFIPEAFQINIPATEQPGLIWQLAKQWGAQFVLVENHGMQTLYEWLELQQAQDGSLAGIEIHPISFGSIAKGQRLLSVTPLLNRPAGYAPCVYFHPKTVTPTPVPDVFALVDGSEREILRPLREQLLSFPTTHDDVMDAVVQGLKWIHVNLVSENRGEEDIGTKTRSGGDAFDFVSL